MVEQFSSAIPRPDRAEARWLSVVGSTPTVCSLFCHRSKDGTEGCEASWLRFKSSRWYDALAPADRSRAKRSLELIARRAKRYALARCCRCSPPLIDRGPTHASALFAGRWSLVTGLLIRGARKIATNPSTAPCPLFLCRSRAASCALQHSPSNTSAGSMFDGRLPCRLAFFAVRAGHRRGSYPRA